jgi:3-methyl-2-oxobutanoate hydroxymethyltransferase
MNVHDWANRKGQKKITMVTCYDATFAKLLDKSEVDCLLVGDSLAMVVYGHSTTLPADMEMMTRHVEAVRRGAPNQFIVADMPFLSYRVSLEDTVRNAGRLMCAGANAVKVEGAVGHLGWIKHLVDSGIPVMGHVGMTPQSVHTLGGFCVQGRSDGSSVAIMNDAFELEQAGCFALVLECVPSLLAAKITDTLNIPTIGIGAGAATDGQVLVLHDLLGLNVTFSPKFLKKYAAGDGFVSGAVQSYCEEVRAGYFPQPEHQYH